MSLVRRRPSPSPARHTPALIVTAVAMTVLILGAALLVWLNGRAMQRQINDDFNQQQLALGRQAAAQIEALLGAVRKDAAAAQLLARDAGSRPTGVAETLRVVLDRDRDRGGVQAGLVSADGRVTALATRPSARPMVPPSPLPTSTAGAVSERSTADGRVSVWLTFFGPPGTTGEARLFEKFSVPSLVAEVLRHIRSGRTGYAWLIDEQGTFLFHPDARFLGRNAFTARHERRPEIQFARINRIMRDGMLRGREGTGSYLSGWHGRLRGRITKLIAYTPVAVPLAGGGETWSLAIVAPQSEVSPAVHTVFVRHAIAEGVLITTLVLLATFMALSQRRISHGLERQVERTRADLHEMERISRRVVEQASDMIYILGLDTSVILANRQTVRLFQALARTSEALRAPGGEKTSPAPVHRALQPRGGEKSGLETKTEDLPSPELYIGKPLTSLLRPADGEFVRHQIATVLEKKRTISYEHTVHFNGAKARLSTKLMPIRDDRAEIRYVLGISRDITEKMELDQRIYNAEKLASIGTLAAGVAHEINNPLAVILGFTDLLLERFAGDSEVAEDLRTIELQANLAKSVVENLLGFARVTEGLEDTIDIGRSLETVGTIVSNTMMTKKIEMMIEVADDLPPVQGDGREFQQVIFNLVNNAVAAMEDHGGTLRIRAWRDGDQIKVSVSDTGVGIPESIRPRIFDPFFTTKKVGEGTGLGLSLCYGIIKKYGGTIQCSSVAAGEAPNVKHGTTFTVTLKTAMRDGAERGNA